MSLSTRPFITFSAIIASSAIGAIPEPREVAVVKPRTTSADSAISLPGRTEPVQRATIFTRATGIISERGADIGDSVKSGDTLAKVAAPDLDQSIAAAKASVEQAAATAANSRAMADRTDSLLAARAVSREEAGQRTTTFAADNAALRLAGANLAKLEVDRAFATVTAPFDGIITARNFDIGDRTRGDSSGADEWLYQLARTDELLFTIAAPPALGLRFSKETTAQISFSEFPGKSFPARFTRSSRSFDSTTGTMRAEFTISNPDLALPAGLTGNAAFTLPPSAGTFILPNNTIILRDGGSVLMIVRDGKAAFITVTQGRNLGKEVEVSSAALTPETGVVINPNALIQEGDPLTVKPTAK